MRIVVLGLRGFPDIQGGVEAHCEHLYTRMAAGGHDVVVLGRKPYMDPALTEYRKVRLVAVACPRQKFLEAFVHTSVGVLRARQLDPDILHIHAIGPSLLVPVARLLGMKVVSTNHGPDYARQKWGSLSRAVLRLGEFLGSRFSNGVIAISEPIAQHLRSSFGCAPAVIPNGVQPRPSATGQESLLRFGLAKGRYVLAVGRLVPEKGFHDLIEAFLKAKVAGWKLVLAGGADHEDAYSLELKRQAAALPEVVMTGFVTGEPLAQLYSHAGLFVLPSYHEGLPIALLEAMSYGLSIVVSDIPANREVGVPDDRVFPAGDVEMAAAMIRHHSSRPLPLEEKTRQIELVARTFDWDVIAAKTVAVYDRVLQGSPDSRKM